MFLLKNINKVLFICMMVIIQTISISLLFIYVNYIHKGSYDLTAYYKEAFSRKYLTITGNTEDTFQQQQSNTCGPASLAYLFNTFGLLVSEKDIVDQVNLLPEGTTLLDLKKTAQNYGFISHVEKQNYLALLETELPVIAHVSNQHYVVVEHIEDYELTLFDPARGLVIIPRDYFIQAWTGYVLIVEMKDPLVCNEEVIGDHQTKNI